jgi:hypothetical protein
MARKPEPIIDDKDIDLDAEVIHVGGRRLTEELADQIAEETARTSQGEVLPARHPVLCQHRGELSILQLIP